MTVFVAIGSLRRLVDLRDLADDHQADPSRDRARGSSGVVGVENAVPGGADFWIRLPAA